MLRPRGASPGQARRHRVVVCESVRRRLGHGRPPPTPCRSSAATATTKEYPVEKPHARRKNCSRSTRELADSAAGHRPQPPCAGKLGQQRTAKTRRSRRLVGWRQGHAACNRRPRSAAKNLRALRAFAVRFGSDSAGYAPREGRRAKSHSRDGPSRRARRGRPPPIPGRFITPRSRPVRRGWCRRVDGPCARVMAMPAGVAV